MKLKLMKWIHNGVEIKIRSGRDQLGVECKGWYRVKVKRSYQESHHCLMESQQTSCGRRSATR